MSSKIPQPIGTRGVLISSVYCRAPQYPSESDIDDLESLPEWLGVLSSSHIYLYEFELLNMINKQYIYLAMVLLEPIWVTFPVTIPWYTVVRVQGLSCWSWKIFKLSLPMNSQPTAADYLWQVTHFISYATLLHLKQYCSALTTMATQSTRECVHWTETEISELVDYLYDHRSEDEGGAFQETNLSGCCNTPPTFP